MVAFKDDNVPPVGHNGQFETWKFTIDGTQHCERNELFFDTQI